MENDLQIIREGSTGGDRSANTNIRATVSGTVLEVPVEAVSYTHLTLPTKA